MSPWAWQDHAACRGEDLSLFFPPEGERGPGRAARERQAKAVCGGCPVRPDCLGHALRAGEKWGTWGGLSEEERESERRRRDRARLAAQRRGEAA